MPKSIKPSGRRRGHVVVQRAVARGRSAGLPLQIVDDAVGVTPEVRALIQREAEKLRQLFDRIVAIRAVITATNRRLHGEVGSHSARLHIAVPRKDLVVERDRDPNLVTAVQKAFKSAGRLVEDHVRRLRARKPRESRP